jgi:hypothetical protein
MKYLLVLGIAYKKYKKPAEVTVSTGDIMIDSFQLSQDHNITEVDENIVYTKYIKQVDYDITKWQVPSFYKVYRLDESQIQNSLSIKVSNANSNYTNGFMTKSALIQIPIIALFPESLTENNCESLVLNFNRINEIGDKVTRRAQKDTRFTVPSINEFNLINDDVKSTCSWPNLVWFNIESLDQEFLENGYYRSSHWFGGNFQINVKVMQKHGLKYLHTQGTKKHGIRLCSNNTFIIASAKNLLNIYNENQ